MIITVTMNPAIDKTVDVNRLTVGGVNRVSSITQDAGGKGINVSKTIHSLGGQTIAAGFLGGGSGRLIEHALNEMDIKHNFIEIAGETRTNTKIVDLTGSQGVTELNEPGPVVTAADMDALIVLLEQYAGPGTLFILSGSVPQGAGDDIYARLVRRLKKKQSLTFVDADGQLLSEAIKARPYAVKPNETELARYFGLKGEITESGLIDMGKELLARGVQVVIISCGKRGALFITRDAVYRSRGIEVKAHSTVGAGDAMVAAFALGLDQKLSLEACAKQAIAASAGACTTTGTKPPAKELVDILIQEVVLEQL